MFKRLIASIICFAFILSDNQYVHAQDFSIDQLPVPGTIVGESIPFTPLALKGLIIDPQKPLEFQFIVDTGRGPQDTASIKDQANQLVKYFLAGLTIPEGDLWVNLSPYEKNRMVPEALGQTDLGRDLLAQDYILKQLTASLIYPEKDLGKEFWSRVYAKAQQQFGTTNVPVNTFNKVWILPDQAQVYENNNAAYVTKSTLKVMLDEDYLALSHNVIPAKAGIHNKNSINSLGSQIVRAIILPEIEKEVNTGKNFAPLRQIYQALILAKWYKETIRNGLLNAMYTNKNKITGVNLANPVVKEEIYERYLQAYKKGAFNYIKEDPTPDGQIIPRKYFSGGTCMAMTVNRQGTPARFISSLKGLLLRINITLLALLPSNFLYARQQDNAVPSAQNQPIVDKQEMANLLAQFKDQISNYNDTKENISKFIRIGKPAVPVLVEALKDQNSDVRRWSAEILGDFEDKSAVPALIEASKDDVQDVRLYAVRSLGTLSDVRSVPALIDALSVNKDPFDYMMRDDAAKTLGKMGDKSAIPALVKALKDEDINVRPSVAQALSQMGWQPTTLDEKILFYPPLKRMDELVKLGKTAIPELFDMVLNDKDWQARYSAAETLYQMGWQPESMDNKVIFFAQLYKVDELAKFGQEAVPNLLKRLKNKEGRNFAAEVLGKIGDPKTLPEMREALNVALKDKNKMDVMEISHALWRLGDKTALPNIIEGLSDQEFNVNYAAYGILVKIGQPIVPDLINLLKSESPRIRSWAAKTLGEIGDTRAVPALRELAEQFSASTDEFIAIRDAKEALVKINRQGELIRLRKDLKSGDDQVRLSAIYDLGKLKDKDAIPELTALFSDKNDLIPGTVAQTLGMIGDPKAVPALIQAQRSPNKLTRLLAVQALGKIGDKRAVPSLEVTLQDNNEEIKIRGFASYSLGSIGDKTAVPVMAAMLKDESVELRISIANDLGNMGDKSVIPALKEALQKADPLSDEFEALQKAIKTLDQAMTQAPKSPDAAMNISVIDFDHIYDQYSFSHGFDGIITIKGVGGTLDIPYRPSREDIADPSIYPKLPDIFPDSPNRGVKPTKMIVYSGGIVTVDYREPASENSPRLFIVFGGQPHFLNPPDLNDQFVKDLLMRFWNFRDISNVKGFTWDPNKNGDLRIIYQEHGTNVNLPPITDEQIRSFLDELIFKKAKEFALPTSVSSAAMLGPLPPLVSIKAVELDQKMKPSAAMLNSLADFPKNHILVATALFLFATISAGSGYWLYQELFGYNKKLMRSIDDITPKAQQGDDGSIKQLLGFIKEDESWAVRQKAAKALLTLIPDHKFSIEERVRINLADRQPLDAQQDLFIYEQQALRYAIIYKRDFEVIHKPYISPGGYYEMDNGEPEILEIRPGKPLSDHAMSQRQQNQNQNLVLGTHDWTDLIAAAKTGNLEIVRESLAQRVSVDARDESGKTALMWAAQYGHQDVIKSFIDNHADVNAKDHQHNSVLYWAHIGEVYTRDEEPGSTARAQSFENIKILEDAGAKDNAMFDQTAEKGGIDLNRINVLQNGKTVNVQFDPAQLSQLMQGGFEGFSFKIESMTKISSPFLLLGIHTNNP